MERNRERHFRIFASLGIVSFLFLSQVLAAPEGCSGTLTKIPVHYSPQMVDLGNETVSFSPSAGKPAHLIDALLARQYPVEIVPVTPLGVFDFFRVHEPEHVRAVMVGEKPNGFGNTRKEIAQTLPYTCGSFYQASCAAIASKGLSCSPTSGFHHASTSTAENYCTFNGIMIAAAKLIESGAVKRIAILDADRHWGNGTDEILSHFPYRNQIYHFSFGRFFYTRELAIGNYLAVIHEIAVEMARFKPDLIMYQAGADPHINDPLGKILTTEEMYARDVRVFSMARVLGIPIVWNLAGGYQGMESVIELHLNTFRAAMKVYGIGFDPASQQSSGAHEAKIRK